MRRRGGMTTGDTIGPNVEEGGIIGIGALFMRPHPCRFISATTQATAIRGNASSSMMCTIGTTTTDLANRLDALATSNQSASDLHVREIRRQRGIRGSSALSTETGISKAIHGGIASAMMPRATLCRHSKVSPSKPGEESPELSPELSPGMSPGMSPEMSKDAINGSNNEAMRRVNSCRRRVTEMNSDDFRSLIDNRNRNRLAEAHPHASSCRANKIRSGSTNASDACSRLSKRRHRTAGNKGDLSPRNNDRTGESGNRIMLNDPANITIAEGMMAAGAMIEIVAANVGEY